jgi:hypothetical protein
VTIALLLIVLWVPSFITGNVDSAWRSPVMPLYNLVADLLDFWPPFMLIFAMLLMAFEVVFFNSILTSNQLIGKVNTLGAVVFLLMMNLLPEQTTFYPFLLSSVFLLMFIHTLFAIYQTPRPELYLLNAGVYLSLATMFWFPSLLLAVWGIIALSIVHKGSFRLHLIPFVGLLFPYFIFFAIHFLKGDLLTVWQAYADYFIGFQLVTGGFTWLKIVLLGFLVLVLFIPSLVPHLYALERSVAVRSKIAMTYNLLLLGILLLFFGNDPMQTGVLFIALSILFSYYMAYLERLKWSNITFIVLILAVLASHYVPLFL